MGTTSASTEFIGREAELARLNAALVRASAGAGVTVIIGGEAGIGKSRVLERFTDDARAGGAHVLGGACIEFSGRGVPFAPFVEAIRSLVRSVEPARLPALLGRGRQALGRLLPELEDRTSAPHDADGGRGEQARLFESVLTVIERSSRSKPTVLVIEDIQWADDDTRDLLAFLLRHLRGARVLAVLSLRTDDMETGGPLLEFVAELEREDWVERLDLAPFDPTRMGQFIRSRLAGKAPAELIDEVLARTGGNPFFAEHILAMLASGADSPSLPPHLRDVLAARLAHLDRAVLEIVRAVAAAGPQADEEMLRHALGVTPRALTAGLRAAIDDGILVMVDAADGSGGYRFRHALMQEAAYAQLLRGERKALHAAFGERLIRRRADGRRVDDSALAVQLDRAELFDRAVPAYIVAGQHAEQANAFGLARRQYERALALWDRAGAFDLPDALDRSGVMQRAAECALLTGAHDRAVELGRDALANLERSEGVDPIRLGLSHDRLRWYLWEAGDHAAAGDAVADALRVIPAEPPSSARARVLAHAAGVRMESGDLRAAMDFAGASITMARRVGAPADDALASGILGWCQAVSGSVDVGIDTLRHGLAIAVRLGGPEGIALGHASLAALLDRIGRTEASLDSALDGYAVVHELGVSRTYGGALLGLAAKASFDLGRWSQAASIADRGLDLDPVGLAAVELHLARARIDLNEGRSPDAARHLRLARELWLLSGQPVRYGPALLAGEADLAYHERRLDDVRAAADACVVFLADDRPVDPALGWLAATALRAEADEAAFARARQDPGQVATAAARAAAIRGLIERASGVAATAADARRGVMLALCEAEGQRVLGIAEPSAWAAVAEGWEHHHRPLPAAYARFRLAEALLATRETRSDAAPALREAHDSTVALGARPLQADIELLARHARIELATDATSVIAPSPADDYGLTERETEVIRLVASGWSNQEIADALFITRKTASVHVSNILGKFGVRNRVEAAAIAHRLGFPPG